MTGSFKNEVLFPPSQKREVIAIENRKQVLGACLSIIGVVGFLSGPALGLTSLGHPWTFLAGFTVGVVAGIGAMLCFAGLAGRRQPPVGG